MATSAQSQTLEIHEIDETPAAAVRETLDGDHVDKLFGWIEEGVEIDPVTIYTDGKVYWLVDGRHRLQAHQSLGKKSIAVDTHRGKTFADAQQAAADANRQHKGLPMSKGDLKCAVLAVVKVDPEVSTAALHRRFGLARSTIEKLRQGVEPTPCQSGHALKATTKRRRGADGKSYRVTEPKHAAQTVVDERPDDRIADFAEPIVDILNTLTQAESHRKQLCERLTAAADSLVEESKDPERGSYVRDKATRVQSDTRDAIDQLGGLAAKLKTIKGTVRSLEPLEICEPCDGSGCDKCRGTGFVPRGIVQTRGKAPAARP